MRSDERKKIEAQLQAKKLLVHYFETAFSAAGLNFSYDNRAEVEEIIDLIFQNC